MAQPEKGEQAAMVELLEWLGAAVYVLGTRRARDDWQGTRQTPGLPDLLAFLPPRPGTPHETLLILEVKARGGRLRPAQAAFREHCEAAAVAHVTGGIDDLIRWLAADGWVRSRTRPPNRPTAPRQRPQESPAGKRRPSQPADRGGAL